MVLGKRLAVAAVAVLALTACSRSGGDGGPGGECGCEPPMVVSIVPTNGQEVLPDLSDPGLDGAITIRFSGLPRGTLEPVNEFHSPGGRVSLWGPGFSRPPVIATVDAPTQSLRFELAGSVLPPGPYELRISRELLFERRSRLNEWVQDFSSSFTVGPDSFPPEVRITSPAANQNEVPAFSPVVLTFNESLDPKTVILGGTVFVEDAGVHPRRPVAGTLVLDRDGFDLVFRPDPCRGFPRGTTIEFRLEPGLSDRVGNGLAEEFRFSFRTKDGVTPPDPSLVPTPRDAVYATIGSGIVVFDCRGAFAEDGSVRPEAVRLVRADGAYGGDWAATFGRPGDAVVDPRADPQTGHAYLYAVDEEARRVVFVHTGTGTVVGTMPGPARPTGLGIGGQGEEASLWVSDGEAGTLTGIPLPNLPGAAPCAPPSWSPEGGPSGTTYRVSKGAAGVAVSPQSGAVAVIGTSGEISILPSSPDSIWRGGLASPLKSPELAWAGTPSVDPGRPLFWATGEREGNPSSSHVGLWRVGYPCCVFIFSSPPVLVGELSGDLGQPGRPVSIPGTPACLIPDRAGDAVYTVDVLFAGNEYFTSFVPAVTGRREVGPYPLSVTLDPSGRLAFAALGVGKVAVWDREAPDDPPVLFDLPGVRSVFSTLDR